MFRRVNIIKKQHKQPRKKQPHIPKKWEEKKERRKNQKEVKLNSMGIPVDCPLPVNFKRPDDICCRNCKFNCKFWISPPTTYQRKFWWE